MILMKHVAIWEIHMARNWGGQPLANRHLVTETLSPVVLKELNPVNKYIDELEVDPSSGKPSGVFPWSGPTP